MGKREIACNEQFLLFPQCFQLNQITVSPFDHFFDIISFFATELEEPTRGPWWPWIAHLSHFPHKMNSTFSFTIVPTCDPRAGASFDPRGIILIELIKVHKTMLHTKNQSFRPSRFREEEFWILPSLSYVQICDPMARPILTPRDIIWINLVEVNKEMLHTKYQSSMPSIFREEEFWRWASLFQCSNLWHPPPPPTAARTVFTPGIS